MGEELNQLTRIKCSMKRLPVIGDILSFSLDFSAWLAIIGNCWTLASMRIGERSGLVKLALYGPDHLAVNNTYIDKHFMFFII